jgi:hypothetical protein
MLSIKSKRIGIQFLKEVKIIAHGTCISWSTKSCYLCTNLLNFFNTTVKPHQEKSLRYLRRDWHTLKLSDSDLWISLTYPRHYDSRHQCLKLYITKPWSINKNYIKMGDTGHLIYSSGWQNSLWWPSNDVRADQNLVSLQWQHVQDYILPVKSRYYTSIVMSVELMQATVNVRQMEIKTLHINSHVCRVDASYSKC